MVVATVGRMRSMSGHQLGIIGYAFARRGFRPVEQWLQAYAGAGIITPEYHGDSIADVAYSLAVFQVSAAAVQGRTRSHLRTSATVGLLGVVVLAWSGAECQE